LPAYIREDPVWDTVADLGAVIHRSPLDQSNCDHLGEVLSRHSSVKNGRCDFFEPYGRTNTWRILDADGNIIPQQGATYYVAVCVPILSHSSCFVFRTNLTLFPICMATPLLTRYPQVPTSAKFNIAIGTWVILFDTLSCNFA
jgi:hypothetical protein